MRFRAETLLIVALTLFAALGIVGVSLGGSHSPRDLQPVGPVPRPVVEPGRGDAAGWFDSVRRYCNPVEIDTRMRSEPAPAVPEGAMYQAACYALAGRIDQARSLIEGLDKGLRYQAAGVVFEAGHPAADAGDDVAAGPLMELVVDFWPNHYMALYHAGAARFELGDYDAAKEYLDRFLVEYSPEDGWRTSALGMLRQIAERG